MTPENIPLDLLSISTILDSLDALVYVSDMQTDEMIFMNRYGEQFWGEWRGKRCWQVLQKGQSARCEFCNNDKLVDTDGTPTGVVVWEFQNTVTGRWYQCRDQAIPWIDGRTVRIEIAFDITERKCLEEQLRMTQEKAEKLARTDSLTELKSRRAFFDEAEQMLNVARRYGRPLSVAMIDIDYFKRINDTHGHFAGDTVLREVARTITESLRTADLAGRIGGEEFAIVLPETHLDDALQICERIRNSMENLNSTVDATTLTVTCSIGVTGNHVEHNNFETLLSAADRALYAAKNRGRNRVERADE